MTDFNLVRHTNLVAYAVQDNNLEDIRELFRRERVSQSLTRISEDLRTIFFLHLINGTGLHLYMANGTTGEIKKLFISDRGMYTVTANGRYVGAIISMWRMAPRNGKDGSDGYTSVPSDNPDRNKQVLIIIYDTEQGAVKNIVPWNLLGTFHGGRGSIESYDNLFRIRADADGTAGTLAIAELDPETENLTVLWDISDAEPLAEIPSPPPGIDRYDESYGRSRRSSVYLGWRR
jgi:hypothetical protein